MPLTGIDTVKRNITRAIGVKVNQLYLGLMQAGRTVQRASMEIVPVDYGNLKASAFTAGQFSTDKNTIIVTVGYTANYAIYVHENLDALHGADFNAYYADQLSGATGLRRDITALRRWEQNNPGDIRPNQLNRLLKRLAKTTAAVASGKRYRDRAAPTKGPFRHRRGDNQQAKFLEAPFRRLRLRLWIIVRDYLR